MEVNYEAKRNMQLFKEEMHHMFELAEQLNEYIDAINNTYGLKTFTVTASTHGTEILIDNGIDFIGAAFGKPVITDKYDSRYYTNASYISEVVVPHFTKKVKIRQVEETPERADLNREYAAIRLPEINNVGDET